MSRKVFYQNGSTSKYQGAWVGGKWVAGKPAPYMFGRGWRKFRKHRFEAGQ